MGLLVSAFFSPCQCLSVNWQQFVHVFLLLFPSVEIVLTLYLGHPTPFCLWMSCFILLESIVNIILDCNIADLAKIPGHRPQESYFWW